MIASSTKTTGRLPILTISLAVLLCAVTSVVSGLGETGPVARLLGAIPAEITAGHRLWTILTSGVLHVHPGHLILNVLILLFAGGYIEQRTHGAHMLRLLIAGIVGGVLAHGFTYPESTLPLYGISAGALALVAAALLRWGARSLSTSFQKPFLIFVIATAFICLGYHLRPAFGGGIAMPPDLLESDIAHIAGFCIGAIVQAMYALRSRTRGLPAD